MGRAAPFHDPVTASAGHLAWPAPAQSSKNSRKSHKTSVFWVGSNANRSASFVQVLQMRSNGVRPVSVFSLLADLYAFVHEAAASQPDGPRGDWRPER